ncbi:MAG TPA: hypothetical protein DCQ36_09750 [Actinobacteria bacterium]|jgi:hypothetical protein|nr:hypothetical protein [Actinomycetota bacterium]
MKKQIRSFGRATALATAALLVVSFAGTASASAATHTDASTRPLPARMTVYLGSDDSQALDTGTVGSSEGDEFFRHGPVSRKLGGKTIGEYFLVAQIVRSDGAGKMEWRQLTRDFILPGGTILIGGIHTVPLGNQTPVVGQVNHLPILGGTGIYRGARGEQISTTLSTDPWAAKVEFLFTK